MSAIDRLMDTVEWVGLDEPDQLHPGDLYATHEGTLHVPGMPPLRVYQLNNGQRVIDSNDVATFFGGTE